MTRDEPASLDVLATEFADKLTLLTRGVLGEDSPRFHAIETGHRLRVAPIKADERSRRIPISINGEPCLSLLVCYYCCWDGSSTFLATDQADIKLFYDRTPDPLLRFEYVRGSNEPPGAHIQVHAHRDEMAYLLRLAEAGRPKQGLKRRKLPRLSEMHLPVGGHRMRPALEDVLLFLHREFAVDVVPGWRNVIRDHLHEWRRLQLKSAVRDSPDDAAEVLRAMGYLVEPPKVRGPRPAPDAVKLFWP
ncbi:MULTISPECIES: hypothetical protein [Streptomyces]|uniref:Uncharacterized protein n=1 Tax=Streptomyces lycii TaxID=2654337 RepID=A0ABQ7FL86_9ACTN|nr:MULTISPECIES: hypothetical protein [Streptomyces]KAF4409590.1 hypothetical protein GCU69_08220 [Streptomyces lycii]PGH49586.1 hypothetical protein CRI70_16830 [Streptomyces sp. Ru87]